MTTHTTRKRIKVSAHSLIMREAAACSRMKPKPTNLECECGAVLKAKEPLSLELLDKRGWTSNRWLLGNFICPRCQKEPRHVR